MRLHVECPQCGRYTALHPNGRLYGHYTANGMKCHASGAEPAQFAAAAAPPKTALCVYCDREVKIRQTGSAEVIGTLWMHRVPDGEGWATWCPGGAQLPAGGANDNTTYMLSGGPTREFAKAMGWDWADEEPVQPQVVELADWWRRTANNEIQKVAAKAIEYGATDLRDLGRDIYEMAGRSMPDDATATETGIAFYIRGKIARVTAAIHEGRQPSYDTWHDIGVYARMAQRVRQAGGWPGTDTTDDEDY